MQEIVVDSVEFGPVDLDITAETCPMTFVRVRLLLDRLAPGGIALVRLAGEEPLRNVPRTLMQQGHGVLHFAPEHEASAAWLLRLKKKA